MTIGQSNYPDSLDTASELIRAVNRAASTVAAPGADADDTTIPITDTSDAPADGTCWIEDEAISYTGKTANSITGCVRGFDGTTAAAHAAATIVYFDPIVARSHNVQSEAIVAIETKLGTGAGAPSDGTYLAGVGAGETSWQPAPAPGGADTQVQYNDNGAFAGDAGLVYDDASKKLTLAVNSDSMTSADSGGPRPKLILKRTGAAGDGDATPAFAPIGDIEWETVHDDGTHYRLARIWVDEESTDPTVNVGRMRIGVHNGDATAYGEDTYLFLTGYGDVDLAGSNITMAGTTVCRLNSSAGRVAVTAHTDVEFIAKGNIVFYDGDYGWPARGFQIPMNVATTGVKTVNMPDVSGTFGIRVAVPATASSTGVAGTWAADATHFYYCVATNTWVRCSLTAVFDTKTPLLWEATTPADGDVLTYDTVSGWVAAAPSGGGGSYTDEQAQDAVGAMVADTATIDATYTDATPELKFDVKDDSVTYAKMQNASAASVLLGRGAGSGAGDLQEIALGTNLSMSGTTLNAAGGLVFITESSFSASSAVSLDGVFTSDYDAYRVLILIESASTDGFLHLRLRASGVDASAGDYYTAQYYVVTTGSSGTGDSQAAATSFRFGYYDAPGAGSSREGNAFDVLWPQKTSMTHIYGFSGAGVTNSHMTIRFNACTHDQNTAYDGFKVYPASGNITGKVRVYGYRNS